MRRSISVIVPAYNAEDTINACIESLLCQTISREMYEVIVVDNGSTDETVARTKDYPVTCISRPNCTVYGARNEGVLASYGEIIAFTDSDCVADEKWLESGIACLGKFDIVTGRVKPLPSSRRLLYTYDKYVGRNPVKKAYCQVNIAALNAFVPRSIFNSIGGFKANLRTAGDSVFSIMVRQCGGSVGFTPHAIVYHPVEGWVHRIRRMMRESYGSSIKSCYREAESSACRVFRERIFNAWRLLRLDLISVLHAYLHRDIDGLTAISLVGITVMMKLLVYGSIVSSRLFGKLNHIFSIR